MNDKIKLAKRLVQIAKELLLEDIDTKEIEKELKKLKINEYKPFKKNTNDEWFMYPKNRNADIPDICLKLDENNKLVLSYTYANSDKDGYEGTPQQTLAGMLTEFSNVKKDIEKAIVEAKNELLERQKEQKNKDKEQQGGEETNNEEDANADKDSAVDDFLNKPLSESGGGEEGGEGEGGGQEEAPAESEPASEPEKTQE